MVGPASNLVELIPFSRVTCDPLYRKLGQIYGGFLFENAKVYPKMHSDCGNISLLLEIGIAECNGAIGILAINSEVTDFAHARLKYGKNRIKAYEFAKIYIIL